MSPGARRTLLLLLVVAGVLWLAYLARDVVMPLLVAVLLAYVLDPAARWLVRRGMSRPAASGLLVGVVFLAVLGATAFATTRLVAEAGDFYDDVVGEPTMAADSGEDAAEQLAAELDDRERRRLPEQVRPAPEARQPAEGPRLWYYDRDADGDFDPGHARVIVARVRSLAEKYGFSERLEHPLRGLEDAGPTIASAGGRVLRRVAESSRNVLSTALGALTLLVLFPIYLYYSLANLERLHDVTMAHLPAAQRPRVADLLGKIHVNLSAFFRGRLVTLLVKGVLLLGAFLGTGVPFAFVCAGFATLASLVPVVGAIVGSAPAVLLLLSSGGSTGQIVALLAALVAIELVENYLLTPALIGRQVGLHPLTVLVSAFVAGELLGVFGMIVAIPLTAIAKILFVELVLPEIRRRAGMQPEAGAGGADSA